MIKLNPAGCESQLVDKATEFLPRMSESEREREPHKTWKECGVVLTSTGKSNDYPVNLQHRLTH